jgi:hypothetical protein
LASARKFRASCAGAPDALGPAPSLGPGGDLPLQGTREAFLHTTLMNGNVSPPVTASSISDISISPCGPISRWIDSAS